MSVQLFPLPPPKNCFHMDSKYFFLAEDGFVKKMRKMTYNLDSGSPF